MIVIGRISFSARSLAANAKPACPAPMITSLSVTISLPNISHSTGTRPIPCPKRRQRKRRLASVDLDPAALMEGLCHGMNRLLYPETVFECHDRRRLSGNRPDKLAAFDDLEVIEAETVAGGRNEAIIGL